MQDSGNSMAGVSFRRLVLGAAFAIGITVAMAPHMGRVRAADLPAVELPQQATDATQKRARPAAGTTTAQNAPATPSAPDARAPKPEAATGADKADASDADADTDAADADATDPSAANTDVTPDKHGIVIQKGNKHIRIEGLGHDRQYDSFEQFVQDAPWLAGLVFLSVLLVFLIPLLIIVLLIWYKLRKNRLANETMLKLAERGVVPPAAAMDAVASGTAASVAAAALAPPPNSPAYEQARYLHRRTVWSDLRKGIILSAVGLALSFWSMLDDGTPNSVGLVLLFVGLGYCLLWFFEDRTTTPRTPSVPPPPGSA